MHVHAMGVHVGQAVFQIGELADRFGLLVIDAQIAGDRRVDPLRQLQEFIDIFGGGKGFFGGDQAHLYLSSVLFAAALHARCRPPLPI
jgi:hypothetical protein